MTFDCMDQRKHMLYADLFKVRKKSTVLETEQRSAELRSSLSCSSNQSSFGDSSSSGFSTPFDSEFCSSESEDGDFMAELTRQMAECMLQEEEAEVCEKEDITFPNCSTDDYEAISIPVRNYNQKFSDSSASNKIKYVGFYKSPNSSEDQTAPLPLTNQSQGSQHSATVSRDRRFKGTESTQQKQFHETEQHYMQYRGRDWGLYHGRKGQIGSGMQAIFLGGSGSKKGSNGTGVFLPRVNTDPNELKKKPGCSTVLIPHRVLHALELHFNDHPNAPAPPLIGGSRSPNHSYSKDELTPLNGQYSQFENQPTKHEEEEEEETTQLLPQEWTY